VTGALTESSTVVGMLDLVRDGDLPVVGSRGRGAVKPALFGSLANSLLEQSSVTTVVIPHVADRP